MSQFYLSAAYALPDGSGVKVFRAAATVLFHTGHANCQRANPAPRPSVSLPVQVVRSDGVTPATNATSLFVWREGPSQQQGTDPNGQVLFTDLLVGDSCTLTAYSRTGGDLNDAVQLSAFIAVAGTNPGLRCPRAAPGVEGSARHLVCERRGHAGD